MAIKVHIRAKHNGPKDTEIKMIKYNCKFCENKFADLKSFTKHGNGRHREEISKEWPSCDHCELHLPCDESLQEHSKKHQEDTKLVLPYYCHFCSEEFTSYKSFLKHSIENHMEEVRSEWILCALCHSYFPSENDLTDHVATIHNEMLTERGGGHSLSTDVRYSSTYN